MNCPRPCVGMWSRWLYLSLSPPVLVRALVSDQITGRAVLGRNNSYFCAAISARRRLPLCPAPHCVANILEANVLERRFATMDFPELPDDPVDDVIDHPSSHVLAAVLLA